MTEITLDAASANLVPSVGNMLNMKLETWLGNGDKYKGGYIITANKKIIVDMRQRRFHRKLRGTFILTRSSCNNNLKNTILMSIVKKIRGNSCPMRSKMLGLSK